MDQLLQQAEDLLDQFLAPQGDVLGLAIQALLFALALLITPLIYRFSGPLLRQADGAAGAIWPGAVDARL